MNLGLIIGLTGAFVLLRSMLLWDIEIIIERENRKLLQKLKQIKC